MYEMLQMTSERHEMLDVPSITITWPQLRAECIQSCEVGGTRFTDVHSTGTV